MSLTLTLTLSASFPQYRSSRFSHTSSALIPRATANIAASARSPLQLQCSFEETRGRIAMVFDKNKNKLNEVVSISTYDTAWVAMVPSPFSSSEPCFPDCVFWLLENQCSDGSWARPHHNSHSLLKKDVLSSTLACILALHKWGVGPQHIQRGLQFIEQNIGWATDETQITPMGFNIVFPALLDYATDSSLNLRLEPCTLNHLLQKRDLELQRCDDDNGDSTKAYLAYIAEGMGKSHNWESSIIKYQRKNGSLFNSPSTTAAAYIALGNSDCLNYLNVAFTSFGSTALPAVYPLGIYYHLCIVDTLQSLGISRYFSREIPTVLNQIYKCWVQGDEEIFMDAITCALAFRILRMNGYNVTSEAITKIVSEGFSSFSFPGNMNAWDINTTLELYKASEIVLYPDEADLDAQNLRLKSLLEQELLSGSIQSSQLNAQVKHALEYPFYAILERMATRQNIEHYNFDNTRILKTSYCWPNICHEDLVSLAVEDYNRCQVIHGEEMREFDRWFVENRLDELEFARVKSVYCYFTAAATIFGPEPELSDARMSLTKHSLMAAVIDDLFDVTGSLEEMKNLIQLVQLCLWEDMDVNVSTECSSHNVRIIFSALRDIICDTAEKGLKLQGRSIKHHLIAIWLDCLHAHMKEAEWRESKLVPTLDEYMSNACVSVSLGPCVLPTLYLLGPKISEEMVSHGDYHNLCKTMSVSGRLLNDIRSFEREVEEGKLNTVSVYMINNGGETESEITREAAVLEMQTWINTERRELHRLVLDDSVLIPKPCKELFWHMSAICQLFYSKDDGFWSQGLMQVVNQIVHQPILLNHQIQM